LLRSIDRYVVNLLLHPIAASLKLTDVQISLLVGFSFTFFYATVGLLLGPLVDRYNRKLIIMVGMVIWTAATAATAFAPNYGTLLVARILVGAGEAALAPAAYSLIAEAFPRQKLSRPTTIFFLGGAIGPGVSLVLAALALGWADLLNQSGSLGFLQNESLAIVCLPSTLSA
jgi:MFS family permease